MNTTQRSRVRLLIKSLNKQRREHKRKIDILCNGIITAQKSFVGQLADHNFTLDFYEVIIGQAKLDRLILLAGQKITQNIPGCSVGIFLLETNSFEFHLASDDHAIDFDPAAIESCFNAELTDLICRSNSVCSINDLFGMGLEANLNMMGKVSLYAIPLSGFGPAVGFMLVWRDAANCITQRELYKVVSVAAPLAKAIRVCNTPATTVTD